MVSFTEDIFLFVLLNKNGDSSSSGCTTFGSLELQYIMKNAGTYLSIGNSIRIGVEAKD